MDTVDADTKEEEEALAEKQLHPPGMDYACLYWDPFGPDSVSPSVMGWEADRPLQWLRRCDFECTASRIANVLRQGLADLTDGFRGELQRSRPEGDFATRTAALDPTQRIVAQVVQAWAHKRLAWKSPFRHQCAFRTSGHAAVTFGNYRHWLKLHGANQHHGGAHGAWFFRQCANYGFQWRRLCEPAQARGRLIQYFIQVA